MNRAVRVGIVRRRLTEVGIGVHQFHRIHEARPRAAGLQRRGDQPRAQALAAGHQVVRGPCGELAQQAQPLGQRFQFREEIADVQQHVGTEPARREERARDLGVAGAEPREFTIVHMVGNIDMEAIARLDGNDRLALPTLEAATD